MLVELSATTWRQRRLLSRQETMPKLKVRTCTSAELPEEILTAQKLNILSMTQAVQLPLEVTAQIMLSII